MTDAQVNQIIMLLRQIHSAIQGLEVTIENSGIGIVDAVAAVETAVKEG